MAETGRKEKDLPVVEDFIYVRGIDSEGKSANIPKSLFGGNLDVASENVLGGVKASPREDTDTNEVKIDPNTGKLYCPPSEVAMATAEKIGGIVADVKTSEETEEVKIDPNTGKAYVKKGQGNPPDEEDITTVSVDGSKVLQFKNRGKDKGMGYIILRSNKTITEQMVQENTIYEVRYDFDLGGATLEIPANCVLDFKGGVISNGKIKGNNTSIKSSLCKIFDINVLFEGSFDIECWYPEWFGAMPNNESVMSTKAIQAALTAARKNVRVVKLTGKEYYIDDTLYIYSYQALIGASPAIQHYSGIRINQTVNKNAIQLTSSNADIWHICLKGFTINNTYDGADMNNCGIYVYNGDVQTCFYHNEIENVCCTYFDKGFMYDGYGDGAFAYNCFHEFAAYYNKIGLHVKGSPSSDNSVTKQPWANLNKWNFCKFMSNSIGGIYFQGTRSQQENVFYSCSIEGNGRNYSLVDYELYTCGGWAFRGSNKSCFGLTRFYNCYIESNLPKRDATLGYDPEKEYVYNNYAYPIDIETNEGNAAFVCYKQSVDVQNCLLSKYVRLFRGQTEFQIRFEGNDYDWGRAGYKAKADITIDHFFFIDWTDGMANYNSIYINESYPKHDKDTDAGTYLSHIKSLFRFSDRANTTAMRNFRIYANHPLLDEVIDYKGRDKDNNPIICSGAIYIDPSANNDNTGITKVQPIPSFAQAERISSWYNRSKEVLWVLINDYNKTSTDNWTSINDRNVRLKGAEGVQYNAKAIKTIYTPWVIENITFNVGINDWKHIIESWANRIEFRNCTFNLEHTDQYIARLIRGGDIEFIGCKFNVSSNSKGTEIKVQHPQYYDSRITLSDCTIQEGFTIARETNYWYPGNPVTKYVGSVVRSKGNGLCFYNGTDVINPDGTLYSNVRHIGTDTSELKGFSVVAFNKIVKNIDLEGETLTIPYDCRLDFQGGKIMNGIVKLQRTRCFPMGMHQSYYFDVDTVTVTGTYAEGQTLYDSSLKKQKLWNGSEWVNLDGTSLSK